jgi:hypothetical protein
VWRNAHATLSVWPTADAEQGRLEVGLPPGLGALTALAVSSWGHGGRRSVPACLLAGGLGALLTAMPWPFDRDACSLAMRAGESSSVGATAPPPPPPAVPKKAHRLALAVAEGGRPAP